MKNRNTIENLKSIHEIARKDTTLFAMSIIHLFDCGISNFTEGAYTASVNQIEERHMQAEKNGTILLMTPDFEKALLDQAYRLSKYPLFDLLLYIKKHMDIYDPEAEADDGEE